MTDSETVINLNDTMTVFTNEKGVAGKLTRLGLPVVKSNEYGTWFDLSRARVVIKVPKQRGKGYKEDTIS